MSKITIFESTDTGNGLTKNDSVIVHNHLPHIFWNRQVKEHTFGDRALVQIASILQDHKVLVSRRTGSKVASENSLHQMFCLWSVTVCSIHL